MSPHSPELYAGQKKPRAYDAAKRRARVLERFSLSVAAYDMILLTQGGRCAICYRQPAPGSNRSMDVDHDHKTGVIRGILCHRCNRGLGYFRDAGDLVSAAAYVANHDTGYRMPAKAKRRRP